MGVVFVELKERDNLQYAAQILNGIRDSMMLLENSVESAVPVSICIVFETAVEKAVSLLDAAIKDVNQ